ncbi:hypothetical protein G4B88_017814 [Cannabis sativa]|uniref:Uncharacterized protein n=1 Tax=Cannabis sativa TaxID=3483 RepID=A0A7J6DNR1_CANSA|nr:hypothetical protein G4B88_017814 [Cannabis sativa]
MKAPNRRQNFLTASPWLRSGKTATQTSNEVPADEAININSPSQFAPESKNKSHHMESDRDISANEGTVVILKESGVKFSSDLEFEISEGKRKRMDSLFNGPINNNSGPVESRVQTVSSLGHYELIMIMMTEEKNNGMVSWSTQKHLLEATNAKPISQNSPLILAAERTHRKDPSNGFNYYNGGWNISEKHYFSVSLLKYIEVNFPTAMNLSKRAILFGTLKSPITNILSVGFSAAPLFIIGAIWFVGFGLCMLVIGLCQCFCQYQHYSHYSRTTYLLSLTFLAVFTITAIIGCVVLYLGQGKFHNETTKTLEYVVEEAESVVKSLENVSTYLNASKNVGVAQFSLPANIKQRIDSIFYDVQYRRVALIIFSAVMLLFVLFGFGKLIGSYWVDPCNSNFDSKWGISSSSQAGPTIYYNQSGPLVPILCNPFNSNITDRQCPSVELNFQNAQQEWKKYVCEVSVIEGICTSVGRLTPIYYDQLMAIVNVSSVLYNYGPFLVELGDCTFVRKTFMNISLNHCSGLRDNSRLIVIGLVLASAAVMLCLFLWVFFTKKSKHGGYDKQTQQDSFSVDRKI